MAYKEIINVIAGGNSFKNCDGNTIFHRGYTIGVNSSAIHSPVHIGISMDRHWATNYHNQIKGKPFLLRKYLERWLGMYEFKCNHETDVFSNVPGTLNGRSSGHCALNLAYQMRPKKLFLFGYDFTGKAYWYGAYPWSKHPNTTRVDSKWVSACESAINQLQNVGIEVLIVGESVLSNTKKISYQEYLNGKTTYN